MSTQAKPFLTPEQYLEIERKAEYKSEYFQGEMFAMGGASRTHNRLVAHLVRELDQQLRSSPCETYPSDMRVQVTATGLYTYPDVVVVCGEPQLADKHFDTLLNPTLIVEILSPSTESYGRGRKFDHYETIESLQHYLLVASDRVHAELFTRQPGGDWLRRSAKRLEDAVELPAIGCRLLLADVYEKVELTAERPPAP
jgi:Uma2 family endonuclease